MNSRINKLNYSTVKTVNELRLYQIRREDVIIDISSIGKWDLSIAKINFGLFRRSELWFKLSVITAKEFIFFSISTFTINNRFEFDKTVISSEQHLDFALDKLTPSLVLALSWLHSQTLTSSLIPQSIKCDAKLKLDNISINAITGVIYILMRLFNIQN